MALLTDGPVSTAADLQAHDSSILDTARTEGIDLEAKIAIAQRELELQISVFLLRMGDGGTMGPAGEPDLRKVVVTAGVERWHALLTLAAVYRDAHGSQLNDRYLARWQQFAKLASETADLAMETGIGAVRAPIGRPSAPTVSGSGVAAPGISYEIAVAWRSAFGSTSAASAAAIHDGANGAFPVVSVTGAPPDAAGWDVFAALAGGVPTRQNAAILSPGSAWTLPDTGLVNGPPAAPGQSPDYYVRRSRGLRRG